jgi:3,4-dihydroxy 2-butanone 4-phosphate synthase/GTP cyclohydrolase II
MTRENASRHQTAFTVSIEAREGVSTGISASDRAHTVTTAIDATKGANNIATPGHVFPLMAREGGVLVRAGHTEAGVDIARLSGLNPSAVICEIMKDDGTMARMPDLVSFAQRHNLKIATIAQLIAYRLRHDRIIKAELKTTLPTYDCGEFNTVLYQNTAQPGEYLALTKGDVSSEGPVLVRMHAMNAFDDIFSPTRSQELHGAMRIIAEAGRGVIVILRDHSPRVLSERLRAHLEDEERPSVELREYGIGAQILLDLGVREMTLLSNHRHNIIGLEGYGLSVVEQRPIPLNGGQLKPVEGKLRESG